MPPKDSKPSDCLIVIFGGSGDLAKRKLIPAIYYLWKNRQAPENFAVVGVSRSDFSDDAYRDELRSFTPEAYGDDWAEFASHLHYQAADSTKSDDWPAIMERLASLSAEHNTGANILFYLAMAPQFFEPIIQQLGNSGVVTKGSRPCPDGSDEPPWQRIIIEKPFGSDLDSARHLNQVLEQTFDENATYPLVHLVERFAKFGIILMHLINGSFCAFLPLFKFSDTRF
jgi:glucose-6-phosphate 1-dehydrogenase